MKYYYMKEAFTRGIKEIDGVEHLGWIVEIRYRPSGERYITGYYKKKFIVNTLEEAKLKFEEMRNEQIVKAQKQIARLQNAEMKFNKKG